MRLLALLIVAAVTTGASAAEVYRWVDKQGRVHYGDRPKHEAQPVDVRTGTAEPTAEAATPEDAARAQECQRKRAQLDNYRRASAIRETDNLGRTKEYTAQEREQLLALTEKQVAEACAPTTAAAQ